VVQAAAKKIGKFSVDFTELDWSSDRYKRTGSYVPEDYIEILKKHDAIL
jgi:tartrate dehydrogenase/decarboxylase/D-malate dehydrogenase